MQLITRIRQYVLNPPGALSARMASGAVWTFAGRLLSQLVGMLRLAVVARFLPPEDIGLMAIVLVTISFLETFTTTGFSQALIQRKGEIEQYFSSVFAFNALRGSILAIAVYLLGPTVADFFQAPNGGVVVSSAGIVMLFRALHSPALPLLHRQLWFKRLFGWEAAGSTISFTTVLILAPLLQNVWAYLLSTLMFEFALLVGSYVVAPWRPTFNVRFSDIIELNRFGRWVLVASVVTFLSLQLDSIVVGRLLGAASLAYYQVAYRIAQLPATMIGQVMATVAFPALSSLPPDSDRFRHVYLRMYGLLGLVTWLASCILLLFADPILRYGFGDQWTEAVPTLRILAVAGFLRSLITVGGKVFFAAGQPRLDPLVNSIRVIVFLVVSYPLATAAGVNGIAWAVLSAMLSVIPVYFLLIHKTIGVSPGQHLRSVVHSMTWTYGRLKSVLT